MENPFIYGDVVKGDYFADREDEQKTLVLDLSSGQNVLLFSPRRYGKTSLMIKVLETLKKNGILTVYVDLYRVSSLESLGKIYVTALTQANASKVQEALQFLRDHIPTIVAKVVVKPSMPSTELEIEFDAPRHDLDKWLDQIYQMPQKIAERKGKRLVVVLDEFQEVANLSSEGTVERGLRSRIQHHDRVSYVFMGSKRHLLNELFRDKNKPLYNIAKSVPLGKIPAKEFTKFIRHRLASVQITIADSCIERILTQTGSHPYYTQQLCHEVFNATFPRKEVSAGDIDSAFDACLKGQSYAFTTIWDSLSVKQRELVTALSQSDAASIYSKEFLTKFSLFASGVQRAIEALQEKGQIDYEGDQYSLSDVFFKEWVRRGTK